MCSATANWPDILRAVPRKRSRSVDVDASSHRCCCCCSSAWQLAAWYCIALALRPLSSNQAVSSQHKETSSLRTQLVHADSLLVWKRKEQENKMIMNKIKKQIKGTKRFLNTRCVESVRDEVLRTRGHSKQTLHGPLLLDDLYDVRGTSSFVSRNGMVRGRGREMERDHQSGNKMKEAILDRALGVGCIGGPQQSASVPNR